MNGRSKKYNKRVTDITQAFSEMQIHSRIIVNDHFASFSLRRPPEVELVFGPVEVTVLPNRYVTVTGDYETCVFARYSGDHWRGAISWIGRSEHLSEYIAEKARLGMCRPMHEFDAGQAWIDILQMRRNKDISNELAKECESIINGEEYVAMAKLVDADIPDYAELLEGVFEIPTIGLIAGHAAMRRLNILLEAEEAKGITT